MLYLRITPTQTLTLTLAPTLTLALTFLYHKLEFVNIACPDEIHDV